jgi:hypothetical protein
MIVTLDLTSDQIDILHEAIGDFVAKCNPQRQWRAVEQASLLAEQLEHSLRPASRKEDSRSYSSKEG